MGALSGAAAVPAGVLVRAAGVADTDALLGLARASGLLETGIAGALERFVVAVRGATLVGACGLEVHARQGLLRTLGVSEAARGQGIGRALVVSVVERAQAEGLAGVYLLTTTARSFFARLGFEEAPRDQAPAGIRESWEFRSGCPEAAVLMRLTPPAVPR
jgi:amino-acid N-acetyltransferase